ncbi:Os10g0317300 [Oryza sativa Japonica Group]|uniref:Os10g0317300 protein n=1 Tax=Oryza sativa subsp. japonica TaxID=39947 RepID=A0A0P0XTB1_ORYSJ|nr:Os10g0317300 [Oryza sativa Japonica Group]
MASSTLLLPGRCYAAFTVRLSRRCPHRCIPRRAYLWWCRCRQPPWPDVDRDRTSSPPPKYLPDGCQRHCFAISDDEIA